MSAMRFNHFALLLFLGAAPALIASAGCAEGSAPPDGDAGGSPSDGGGPPSTGGGGGSDTVGGGGGDDGEGGEGGGPCGDMCDADHDGVVDGSDECPVTPLGEPVNSVGCSEWQLEPTLQEEFPPYGLTWTPTGDIGRVGGLTWTYTGIDRGELFNIYWILCDDPESLCGVSLNGEIDVPEEAWVFDATASNLAMGRMVFTNTTNILLADTTSPALAGRLTVTVVGASGEVVPFADIETLEVVARDGGYGVEIPADGFTLTALIEVQDATAVWTPYLDYYDVAATPEMGATTVVSVGGSFYDE